MYGIDPQELAHTVQVGVACSTSVSPLPGKAAGSQVMIQGNQICYVADLLLGEKTIIDQRFFVTYYPYPHVMPFSGLVSGVFTWCTGYSMD